MKNGQSEKEQLSNLIDVPIRTIYNWEKNRPKLYNFLMNCLNNSNNNLSDIEKVFNELTDTEKEMYLSEMKARILRRKLDKKEKQ